MQAAAEDEAELGTEGGAGIGVRVGRGTGHRPELVHKRLPKVRAKNILCLP